MPVIDQFQPPQPHLSPRDLAQVIGVSESSLKRWIDQGLISAQRTSGGHRRIAAHEALRFIRAHRHPIRDLRPLGLASVASEDRPLGDRLHDLLLRGDATGARALVMSAWAAGVTVAQLADGPLREAMARIGERWRPHQPPPAGQGGGDGARGRWEEGVALEHQATDALLMAVQELRLLIPEAGAAAPLALGAAPAGDPYLLPSLCAATAFAEAGWRVVHLGPDTPIAALRAAAARHRPRLLWLVLSRPEAARSLRGELPTLAEQMRGHQGCIVVGGQAADELAVEPCCNLVRTRCLGEAVAYARGLLAAPVSS